jgi:hypothetical protein
MQKSEWQDLHILNLFGETSYLNAICLELPELTRIYYFEARTVDHFFVDPESS